MAWITKPFRWLHQNIQTGSAVMTLESQMKTQETIILQDIRKIKLQNDNIYHKLGLLCHEQQAHGEKLPEIYQECLSLLENNLKRRKDLELQLQELQLRFQKEIMQLKENAGQNRKKQTCPTCGSAVLDDVDLFCRECGADLRRHQPEMNMILCPSCNELCDNSKDLYCHRCGHQLETPEI